LFLSESLCLTFECLHRRLCNTLSDRWRIEVAEINLGQTFEKIFPNLMIAIRQITHKSFGRPLENLLIAQGWIMMIAREKGE